MTQYGGIFFPLKNGQAMRKLNYIKSTRVNENIFRESIYRSDILAVIFHDRQKRRGHDENRCSGSGLSEYFTSVAQDVGRDCRPPREPTTHTTTILRLVHTWPHLRFAGAMDVGHRHAWDTLRASSNVSHECCDHVISLDRIWRHFFLFITIYCLVPLHWPEIYFTDIWCKYSVSF